MSFNKYMHPRNIYRKQPDFKALAVKYPQFRKHISQDLSGKIRINFRDPAALRALTTTLLKEDFELIVDIPLDRMIPTLPLRLNYLLWLEDILLESGISPVYGIDIGTGSACIYPLLAAKTKQWSMLATEMDSKSCEFAKKNVINNNLDHLIEVKQVSPGTLLEGVLEEGRQYSFCMCNPPFYSSEEDLDIAAKSRTPHRPPPSSQVTGTKSELVVEGGEVAFVRGIINESKKLKTRVRIYTTKLGHKSSVKPLLAALKESEALSYTKTEFYQGRTMRWALAWSFDEKCILKDSPSPDKKQPRPPITYTILPADCKPGECNVGCVTRRVEELLDKLEIYHENVETDYGTYALEFVAFRNTWSNQRKKRREQKFSSKVQFSVKTDETSGGSEAVTSQETRSSNTDINCAVECDSSKRKLDGDNSNENKKRIKSEEGKEEEEECLLRADIVVSKVETGVKIEMFLVDGTGGRESLNQVMQYFKNNLKHN